MDFYNGYNLESTHRHQNELRNVSSNDGLTEEFKSGSTKSPRFYRKPSWTMVGIIILMLLLLGFGVL